MLPATADAGRSTRTPTLSGGSASADFVHRHHQSRDLGPPPHGHPRRPLGLARHRARLPRPPAGESPPARASSNTPSTWPSAPTCPPRGRTSSISPTTPAGASTRSSASPGTNLTRPAASFGSRPPVRRPWWGGFSRSHNRLPRPSRADGRAATPTARWSSTATAFPSAAGARRGAPPVRRLAYRPASSTIAAAPPPAT